MKISSYAAEADCIVSVPVMKTHMYAIASLSLKNMKGCLHQREKMRFHHLREEDRFAPWHGFKNLDRAVADLSSVLYADLVVIDGIVAMEGLGPISESRSPLAWSWQAEDPIAADTAALFLMGFSAGESSSRQPGGDEAKAHGGVRRSAIWIGSASLALRTPFKRAVAEDVTAQFPEFRFSTGETCSACEATAMAFLKTYGKKYAGMETVQVVMGKKVDPKEWIRERCIVLGNCAARFREMGIFLEGCPPIPSDLMKAVTGLNRQE